MCTNIPPPSYYLLFVIGLCVIIPVYSSECHTHWNYDDEEGTGPSFWGDLCEEWEACKIGLKQSPINIEDGNTALISDDLTATLHISYETFSNASFINNGHTVAAANNDVSNRLFVYGDIYPYILRDFHFHSDSEHELNGKKLPLEIHLVHIDSEGDVAVLGFLFQLNNESNLLLDELYAKLSQIPEEGDTTFIETVNMTAILQSENMQYYHYQGSLTTPPCTENVKWFISKNILPITSQQLDLFQSILKRDARPIQPLNGRIIESHQLSKQIGPPPSNMPLLLGATVIFTAISLLLLRRRGRTTFLQVEIS